MKYVPLIFLLTICRVGVAQAPELKADESIPIPKVTFDDKGDVVLKASPTSSASDFDFLVGKWRMHNRHLNQRRRIARSGRSSIRPMRTAKSSPATPTWTYSTGESKD